MAGDIIAAKADYYYTANGTQNSNPGVLQTLATTLLNTLLQPANAAVIHGNASTISTSLQNSTPLSGFLAPQGTSGTNAPPRAYLTYIFFDERFNFLGTSEGTGSSQVSIAGNGTQFLIMNPVKAPKNGYVYIYLSNASTQPVYFDNFAVSHSLSR